MFACPQRILTSCTSKTDHRLATNEVANSYAFNRKILEDPLVFGPEIGPEAQSILTGLLTRDPARRLGANGAKAIKKHPFFEKHINFRKLLQKEIQPPFKPSVASPVVSV
jgi:serum/glucocorticoid-regulated kinase 2